MYFVLIGCAFLLFCANFFFFNKDIFQPSVLLNLLFFCASVFALYLYSFWELSNYSLNTVFIIVLGLLSFTFSSILGQYGFIGNRKLECSEFGTNREKTKRVEINKGMLLTLIAVSSISVVWFVAFFLEATDYQGIVAGISVFKNYRTSGIAGYPFYLKVLLKTGECLANIALIIFVYNALVGRIKIIDLALLLFVVNHAVISLLSANRGDLLMLVISGFMSWVILYRRINPNDKKWGRLVYKGITIGVLFLILFWLYVVITKRVSNTSDKSFMKYICTYISGPFASFDLYLKQGGKECEFWGQETFNALNNNLALLFHTNKSSTRYLEFRSTSTYSTTNIYTSFRRFYHDFGYVGVVVLSFVQGFITSKVYAKVRRNRTCSNPVDFWLCFYCFFSYTIVYTLTDELFYSSNVSISGVVKIALLYICYKAFMYKSVNQHSVDSGIVAKVN